MFPVPLQHRLSETGVVAVLVIDDAEHAVPLARALLNGGVHVMELTLRTDAALEGLRRIKTEVPDMMAGVGTILSPEQVRQAKEAGAAFGVSPGCNPNVVQAAETAGLPFAPGIMSPSDIEAAVELGCKLLKFFPAGSSGGLNHLRNIAAPYNHLGLKYIPLGGINRDNMGEYLDSPLVAAVGGSWLAKRDVIAAEDWTQIEDNARDAVDIIRKRRAKEMEK